MFGKFCGTFSGTKLTILIIDGLLSVIYVKTVAGSEADARVAEGANATLEFAVSLDRGAGRRGPIFANYTTVHSAVVAGSDCTQTSGTLTFNHGKASKIVSVPVLDDSSDEGEETLTLRLSGVSQARISDGEATGTISD